MAVPTRKITRSPNATHRPRGYLISTSQVCLSPGTTPPTQGCLPCAVGTRRYVSFVFLFDRLHPCRKPRYNGPAFSFPQGEFLRNVFVAYGAVQSVKYIREKGNRSRFMNHVCLATVPSLGILSPASRPYDILIAYHGPYMRGTGASAAQ
jgi:hypothetical protein